MALNESATFVVSLVFSVLTFSTMQILKPHLIASQPMTIVGGFIGSFMFIFLLTAVANLEKTVFGKQFQAKWLEVVLALGGSMFASASVHRVCATTCFLFSLGMLYSLNKMSTDEYGVPEKSNAPETKAKKKK